MTFGAQWREIERRLPENWAEAQLVITIGDKPQRDRAAALLGPANPGRSGDKIRFFTARRGTGIGPEALRRLLRRLDAEEIEGTLELVGAIEAEAPETAAPAPVAVPASERLRTTPPLVSQWEDAMHSLPADWSDLYAEVEFRSTDYLDRAALLLSPVNPSRAGEKPAFRFRVARRFGYGASATMARRCFGRLDEEAIAGELSILWAVSDTDPVGTQGPVWHVGGKTI